MRSGASDEFREAVDALRRGNLNRAKKIAQSALESAPSAEWQHLLGVVHCRLGAPQTGVSHLRAAVDADPSNLSFQVMLMRALVDCGRPQEVLAMAEPPPATSKETAALWHGRAEAADRAGDFSAASTAWSAVAAANPRDWRAWANLGNALASQEKWDECADALGRAVELNPADSSLRRNAGSALAHSDRLDEAAKNYEAAVALDPQDMESVIALARILGNLQRHDQALALLERTRSAIGERRAEILIEIGRRQLSLMDFETAGQTLLRAVELDPTNANGVQELGNFYERTSQLDRLAQLLEDAAAAGLAGTGLAFLRALLEQRNGRFDNARMLLEKADPDADRVGWFRLKSRIADSCDEPAEAFEAAESMNRSTKGFDRWRREAKAYRDSLRANARVITSPWARGIPAIQPPQGASFAFLVGFPRSGTTLLETFIMGHSRVTALQEEHALSRAAHSLGGIARLADASPAELERAQNEYLAEASPFVPPGFDGLVLDKQPLNMVMAPLIHSLFPGAPVIFAMRHPCDVVLSAYMQSFVPSPSMANFLDIKDAADFYASAMSLWTASVEALPLNVTRVKYEKLVADPRAALRPVFSALGLEWEEGALNHQSTARRRGAIKTASYDQVTQPVTARASGRWKCYREQLEPVLPILLPWAERLGYGD